MKVDPPFKSPFRRGLKRRLSRKTDFSVCSVEERQAILFYLLNMIRAGFGVKFTEQVFNFCVDVIGVKNAYSLLKPLYRTELDYDDTDDLFFWASRKISDRGVMKIIHEVFIPRIEMIAGKRSGARNRELVFRLSAVRDSFMLTDAETSILELFYMIQTHSTVSNYFGEDPLDLTSYHLFKLYGHTILGLDRRKFRNVLNNSALFDAKLINEENGLSIDDRICDYLLGIGERELNNVFFAKNADTDLSIRDFFLSREELRVLGALLKSRNGCNVLFYGAPGTGKTSLAKCLARHFNMDLYTVRIDEGENDYGFRLKAIYATLNVAQGKRSLIVVDEADEILNTAHLSAQTRSKNTVDKSWINNLLDTHNRKMIWITNQHWAIESSTIRRFAFSLEFENLTAKNRMTILQHELKKHRIENYFTESEKRDLCKTYTVDGSGIVHAINLLNINKNMKKEVVLKMVETVLNNHEKATRGENAKKKKRDFKSYSLQGLNTSHELSHIISVLKEFGERKERVKTASVSLLLYGPPGAGKSEFVHCLGDRLGKDIVMKRVSDIQDMYVGQTEKNIARAFREARDDDSILFFDEADSFFYPRKDAVRSWEKSFTNEILAQLDEHSGIVVFATNDIDGLDHAAFRRFKFKVKFSFLEPDGILHFYNTLLAPLAGAESLTTQETKLLKTLRNLTPGDFAVVRDQYDFGKGSNPLMHKDLIERLIHEVQHKKVERTIGF